MLNEILSEPIQDFILPENLIQAVKDSRNFDKTVQTKVSQEALTSVAHGLINYGLQLVRPHIIIDILVQNN
jgi:hypothetical protein